MYRIAYCSNVHAGADLPETRRNLKLHAVQVKRQYRPQDGMGIGLWLSDRAASELIQSQAESSRFADFLNEEQLEPFTFNGFPFGNFHQPVVKHAVYEPNWFSPKRLAFTKNLVQLIHQFAPEGETSISTLPICWGSPAPSSADQQTAGQQLRDLARFLADFESETGRRVYVCIEPEPGCVIQYAEDVVQFFEKHLLVDEHELATRRHIRVCHDVCHSVVMGESQRHALSTYQKSGIQIGKIQISSAVWVDFDSMDAAGKQQAIVELSSFSEDRYLHQTTIQQSGEPLQFFEDLPLALHTVEDSSSATGVWKIHFHVPVYLNRFGQLRASQQEIIDCMAACREFSDVKHFEVETYAWNVLPAELQQQNLATGIARELEWFDGVAQKHLGPRDES